MATMNALTLTQAGAFAMSQVTTGKVQVTRAALGTSKAETDRAVNGLVEPTWTGAVEGVSIVDPYTSVFTIRIKSSQVAQSTDFYELELKTNQGITFGTAVIDPPIRFVAGTDCVIEMPLNYEAPISAKVDSLSVPEYATIPAVVGLEFLPAPSEAGCTSVVVHNVYGDGEPVVATKTGNALSRWSFSGHYCLGVVPLKLEYTPKDIDTIEATTGWDGEQLILYVCAGSGYGSSCVATQQADKLVLDTKLSLNRNSCVLAYRSLRNILPPYTGDGGDLLVAKRTAPSSAGLRLDFVRVWVDPNATSVILPSYPEKYRLLQQNHLVFDSRGLLNPTQSLLIGSKLQLAITYPERREVVVGLFYYDKEPGALSLFSVSNTEQVKEVLPVDNQLQDDHAAVAVDALTGKPTVPFTFAAGRFVPLGNLSTNYCFIGQSFSASEQKSQVFRKDTLATETVTTGTSLTSAVFFLNGVPTTEVSLNADGSVKCPVEHKGKVLTILGTVSSFHTPIQDNLALSWEKTSKTYVTGGYRVNVVESSQNELQVQADEVLFAMANGVYLSPNEYTFDTKTYRTETTGSHVVVFVTYDKESSVTDVVTKHKFVSAATNTVTLRDAASHYVIFAGVSCQPKTDVVQSVSSGTVTLAFPADLHGVDCELVEFKPEALGQNESGVLTRRGYVTSYRPVNAVVSEDDTLLFAHGAYVQEFSVSMQGSASVVVADFNAPSFLVSMRSAEVSGEVTRVELNNILNALVF